MFEFRGKSSTERFGRLTGSTSTEGEIVTDDQIAEIIGQITCLDPACDAPLQLVRGSAARRTHIRHTPGTGTGCHVGSPMTEWHTYVQHDLFKAAYGHEHSIPGARIDAVVKRISSQSLVAIEVQHSPIKKATIMQRHERHRAAGIAGTVWIVSSKHLDIEGRIKTRWVADLVETCLETPASPQGTPGYGCTVGFLDLDPEAGSVDALPTIRFASAVVVERFKGRPATRVASTTAVPVATVKVWASGSAELRAQHPDLTGSLRTMDGIPTRRIHTAAKLRQGAARKAFYKSQRAAA